MEFYDTPMLSPQADPTRQLVWVITMFAQVKPNQDPVPGNFLGAIERSPERLVMTPNCNCVITDGIELFVEGVLTLI